MFIKITDAGTFTQSNCPTDAFQTQGKILVDTADNDVVGGWDAGGNVDPSPSKAYPIPDPLAALPAPTPPKPWSQLRFEIERDGTGTMRAVNVTREAPKRLNS